MTDRLLSFVQHPWGRRVARAIGLPQPMALRRRDDAWQAQELTGRTLRVISPGSAAPMPSLLTAIAAQGGTVADDALASALVIDATGCRDVAALQALFMQAQLAVSGLAPGGRVLALTSSGAADAAQAACLQAVSGFIRALAKEIGRRGATANALVLAEGAASAESLSGALRFFATDRSAYVSGQVLTWRKDTE
ncbi:3-oxoacyl-ACP reductase, partial [Roseateles chitinivorans]